jgi:serine/threonine-protein kinase
VVHRDIKPDNIFLARHDDDPEFAKILDFGIAKLVGEGGSTITQAGITVGTPAYLSPEQAFGGELDGRSDLYSLSVVLYEMLAGRTPFSDRDLMAMLTAHAVADVPRFAEVAPEAEIPAAVEALVMGGLAKQPSQRIPTAAEYVARIDDLLTGRVPTAPVVPSGPYPAFSGRYPAQPSREMAAAPLTGSLLIAVRRPGWQRTAMIVGGAILLVGVIAGIATQGGDAPADKKVASGTATARPPARKSESKPAIPPAPPPDAAPAPELAVKIPPLEATPPPEPATAPVDKEAAYKAAVKTLTKGKTCEARKAAIPILVDLGFKRAVAHLKKARYRMRGGVLGIGDSNTNACLKADAEAAIKTLSQAAR